MTGHGGLYYGLVENFLSSVGRELRAFVRWVFGNLPRGNLWRCC